MFIKPMDKDIIKNKGDVEKQNKIYNLYLASI